jgi:hypothetical protein
MKNQDLKKQLFHTSQTVARLRNSIARKMQEAAAPREAVDIPSVNSRLQSLEAKVDKILEVLSSRSR